MYRLLFRVLALSIAMFVPAGAGHAAPIQSHGGDRDTQPNLTGVWRLNSELSDDPATIMETMHGGSGGGHSMPFGGHGPGMHGGGRAPMDPEQIRARMALVEAPRRLTITQTERTITLTDGAGRSQILTPNNRKQKVPIGNSAVDVKAKWADERLIKETSLADGTKITETYSLIPDARQLHVSVKIESSQMPRAIVLGRVYDAETL
jgi:hypothetical protein